MHEGGSPIIFAHSHVEAEGEVLDVTGAFGEQGPGEDVKVLQTSVHIGDPAGAHDHKWLRDGKLQEVNVALRIAVEEGSFVPTIDDDLNGLFLRPKELERG